MSFLRLVASSLRKNAICCPGLLSSRSQAKGDGYRRIDIKVVEEPKATGLSLRQRYAPHSILQASAKSPPPAGFKRMEIVEATLPPHLCLSSLNIIKWCEYPGFGVRVCARSWHAWGNGQASDSEDEPPKAEKAWTRSPAIS